MVLSRYPEIFEQCHASAERYAKGFRKILVIDRSREQDEGIVPDEFYAHTRGWQAIRTYLPFSMARNGSIGMMAAWPDDVLYMGDDVQLQQEDAVFELQRVAYSHESIGIVSPRICGACGHHLQSSNGKQIKGDYAETKDVVFPCVFIKRRVFDDIGYLDLRFEGYGGDDIDFSRRAKEHEWKLVVTPNVTVLHGFGSYDGTATFQKRGVDTAVEVAKASGRMQEKPWEEYVDGTRE